MAGQPNGPADFESLRFALAFKTADLNVILPEQFRFLALRQTARNPTPSQTHL